MNIIRWSKKFETYKKIDVLNFVKKTEKLFWSLTLASIVLVAIGCSFMMATFFHYGFIGLILILAGFATMFLAIFWVFIRLAICEIVSEIRLQNNADKMDE
jgi:uncharacterized membrane protein